MTTQQGNAFSKTENAGLKLENGNPLPIYSNGTIHFDPDSTLHVGVKNESSERRGAFGWIEKIWIPVGVAVIGLLATGVGAYIGSRIDSTQQTNAEVERMVARAAEASQARHETVSEYANNVTNRLTEHPDMKFSSDFGRLLHGETITTFKRLDDSREQGRVSEIQELKGSALEKIKTVQTNPLWFQISPLLGRRDNYQFHLDEKAEKIVKLMEGFDDAGDLKGNLVRFLYESGLLSHVSPVSLGLAADGQPISLVSGADLRRINLSSQPLSGANLRKAYMGWSNFSEAKLDGAYLSGSDLQYANLRNASLKGARLDYADLRYADLRGANLTDATVSEIRLLGACYDAYTRGLDGIESEVYGMELMTEQQFEDQCY